MSDTESGHYIKRLCIAMRLWAEHELEDVAIVADVAMRWPSFLVSESPSLQPSREGVVCDAQKQSQVIEQVRSNLEEWVRREHLDEYTVVVAVYQAVEGHLTSTVKQCWTRVEEARARRDELEFCSAYPYWRTSEDLRQCWLDQRKYILAKSLIRGDTGSDELGS